MTDNHNDRYHENATVLERLEWYRDSKQIEQGRCLAKLCDYLEDCFLWDIEFQPE